MTATIEDEAKELCEKLSCHEIPQDETAELQQQWDCDPRCKGIERPCSAQDVLKLRGTLKVEYSFADAEAATALTSNIDERDRPFLTGEERTSEGFHYIKNGVDTAIARAMAYAPYADLVWCKTSRPGLAQAKKFAEAVRAEFPDKLLAYNCSPSFNWNGNLTDTDIARFQKELGLRKAVI